MGKVFSTATTIHGPLHMKDGSTVFHIKEYGDGEWWRYRVSCFREGGSIYIECTSLKAGLPLIIGCDMVDELCTALQALKAEAR